MSVETNKQLVLSFFEKLSAGKINAALALLGDTATWWVAGRPDRFEWAGATAKEQFAEMLKAVAMPKGMRVTPKGITAEGDRVALEVETRSEMVGGKSDANVFHYLCEVRGGKLQTVREYFDTIQAKEVCWLHGVHALTAARPRVSLEQHDEPNMPMPTGDLQACGGREVRFGPFRLYIEQRVLLRGDKPVRLGSRAREILVLLVERAGDIVKKRELMGSVWPGTVVVEGTLRVHISALRRALGEGHLGIRYVENVTGHGYRFVAPLVFTALGLVV
jgi:DNA-binding winged helix-turn-helix (wHTH) protein/ketosteroid isomerase-like protein